MAKQLDIFLDSRPGRMASVTKLLYRHRINIRAVTIQDRGDLGLKKLLADKPQEAHLVFSENGFACSSGLTGSMDGLPGIGGRAAGGGGG